MLINFCDSSLKPQVTCNTICSEGHEVMNLVSDDPEKKRKGFLAYNTISPPIFLTLDFLCSVDVRYVIIWPQIGSQKSTGFELSAKYLTLRSESKVTEKSYVSSLDYRKVASSELSETETGLIFYREDVRAADLPTLPNTFQRKIFQRGGFVALVNATSIQLRIFRTKKSVPALARFEVWGFPGKGCSTKVRENAIQLWSSHHLKSKEEIKTKPKDTVKVKSTDSSSSSTFHIPEEFLDPITCELMTVPVILPSGKVVDQSTLDKHEKTEANWGRFPCDPFTGTRFTKSSRPVLAVSLKARIDKFLVDNSDKKELHHVPRTLGRRKDTIKFELPDREGTDKKNGNESEILDSRYLPRKTVNVDKLVVADRSISSEESKQISNTDGSYVSKKATDLSDKKNSTEDSKQVLNLDSKYLSKKVIKGEKIEPKLMETNEITICDKTSQKRKMCLDAAEKGGSKVVKTVASVSQNQTFGSTIVRRGSPGLLSEEDHEDFLDRSLDIALKSTLSGLPTFLRFTDSTSPTSAHTEMCCENCKSVETLFTLPCSHAVCRLCLVNETKMELPQCYKCKQSFRASEPVRYHH